MDDSIIHPDYKHLEGLLTYMNFISLGILFLVILIFIFSKPEWCYMNGLITDDCSSSMDPNNKRKFILGKFPILIDGEEKNILLILCGIALQVINFVKLKICLINSREKKIFYLMIILNVVQISFFMLWNIGIMKVKIIDMLMVF